MGTQELVATLRAKGAIRSPSVEDAFLRVDRLDFVKRYYIYGEDQRPTPFSVDEEPTAPSVIYSDNAVVTRIDASGIPVSSTSQPTLVAVMLELLELEPGLGVLEIGTGTGYNAALLAEIVGYDGRVVTVDIKEDVVEEARDVLANGGWRQVLPVARDGFLGVAEKAPFDRVVATVGCSDLSPHWVEQLDPSGFVLIPLRQAKQGQPLTRIWLEDGDLRGRVVGHCGFMMIEGAMGGLSSHPRLELNPQEHRTLPMWTSYAQPDMHAFWYFLGISDQRAAGSPGRFGLAAGSSYALLEGETILHLGHEELLEDLNEHFTEWVRLGRPSREDFRMTFVPTSDSFDPPPGVVRHVKRSFFIQCFALDAPAS